MKLLKIFRRRNSFDRNLVLRPGRSAQAALCEEAFNLIYHLLFIIYYFIIFNLLLNLFINLIYYLLFIILIIY